MTDDRMKLVSPVWTHLSDVVIERAAGVYVYTSDGRRYLDFASGIGVTNTGHCHPRVVAAAQAQIAKVIHAQINVYYHQPILDLVAALRPAMPSGIDTLFRSLATCVGWG
ncbi:MAG: aminotransferase class III-fold pyridoxal phosphate-dependent enzyme [Chloroflexota bacterium]|nr:aminotransferase class III-fold pyridoxal phosphate-dependent enzyme [Chloroflexota bacterium]